MSAARERTSKHGGHVARSRAGALPGEPAFAAAAGVFRAVGEVGRLRLLARLAGGPWCVSELAEALGEELTTVSQRLRVLRTEGLVVRERDGRHIYYSLADDHIAELIRNALDHAAETSPPHAPRGAPRRTA